MIIEFLKRIFNKIFKKDTVMRIADGSSETNSIVENRMDKYDISEVIKLQNDFEAGKISEYQMSKDKLEKLVELYEKQVMELKNIHI